jgi:hypothetical protein
MKVILVTETQYRRIFLREQEEGINMNWEWPSQTMAKTTFNTANAAINQTIEKVSELDKHDVLDFLSIAALLIPAAGPAVSTGLEVINSALYFYEGEKAMGFFTLGLSLIPQGMVLRRAAKTRGVLKHIDSATDWALKSKNVTKKEMNKKLISLMGKQKFLKNQSFINKYFDESLPLLKGNTMKQATKKLDNLIKITPTGWKSFLSSKQMEKLVTKNNGNVMKAYLAYLRRIAQMDTAIAGTLMGLLVKYEDEVADGISFALTEVPYLKDLTKWLIQINLRDSAKRGDICSIIKLDGYNCKEVQEIFMVTPYKENKEQNYSDNILLKKAWESGWIPYETDWFGMYDIPEKFRTEKYKKYYNERMKEINGDDINNLLKQSPESIERLSDSELTNFLDSTLTSTTTMSNPEMQDMIDRVQELIGDK